MPWAEARGPKPVGRRGPGRVDTTPTRERPQRCTCPDCVAEFGDVGRSCSARTVRRHWERAVAQIDVACAPAGQDVPMPDLQDHETDDDFDELDLVDGPDVCNDGGAEASAPVARATVGDMPDYTGIGPTPAPRSAVKHPFTPASVPRARAGASF